jgi:elongation factor 1 alpha-like protein
MWFCTLATLTPYTLGEFIDVSIITFCVANTVIRTGDVLCSPASPIKNITSFTAKILSFDHVTPMHVDIHRGRLHVPGRITGLVALLDKGSGAIIKKKPRLVPPGSLARVRIEVEDAVPLEAPTRVVLRSGGETIAAGLIE